MHEHFHNCRVEICGELNVTSHLFTNNQTKSCARCTIRCAFRKLYAFFVDILPRDVHNSISRLVAFTAARSAPRGCPLPDNNCHEMAKFLDLINYLLFAGTFQNKHYAQNSNLARTVSFTQISFCDCGTVHNPNPPRQSQGKNILQSVLLSVHDSPNDRLVPRR